MASRRVAGGTSPSRAEARGRASGKGEGKARTMAAGHACGFAAKGVCVAAMPVAVRLRCSRSLLAGSVLGVR